MNNKVHTSVDLTEKQYHAIKVKLARDGKTYGQFVRDAVEAYLANGKEAKR